jgi:hypothetical protein
MEREFKVLGSTLWWKCTGCGRYVHYTRPSMRNAGIDRRCSQECNLRHCVTWESRYYATNEARVYTYNPRTCDYKQLPLIARL